MLSAVHAYVEVLHYYIMLHYIITTFDGIMCMCCDFVYGDTIFVVK